MLSLASGPRKELSQGKPNPNKQEIWEGRADKTHHCSHCPNLCLNFSFLFHFLHQLSNTPLGPQSLPASCPKLSSKMQSCTVLTRFLSQGKPRSAQIQPLQTKILNELFLTFWLLLNTSPPPSLKVQRCIWFSKLSLASRSVDFVFHNIFECITLCR
jgi:hypothetical protein